MTARKPTGSGPLAHNRQGWSPGIATTLAECAARGESIRNIACRLHRTEGAVRTRLSQLKVRIAISARGSDWRGPGANAASLLTGDARRRKPRGDQKPRRCLGCGQMFASTSIGNRQCPHCSKLAWYLSSSLAL